MNELEVKYKKMKRENIILRIYVIASFFIMLYNLLANWFNW